MRFIDTDVLPHCQKRILSKCYINDTILVSSTIRQLISFSFFFYWISHPIVYFGGRLCKKALPYTVSHSNT